MWESIVTVVAISIALPLACQIFYFFQRLEEKKRKPNEYNRTRAPKALIVFFLVVAALFFCAAIASSVSAIVTHEPLSTVIIFSVGFGLFAALPVFGYMYLRFRYEIFDNEKVTVVRFFKSKAVYFDEIAYYNYLPGMIGGLSAYDKNGVTLFTSEGINIGIEKFVYEFAVRGIHELNRNTMQSTFGKNPVFIKYKKKTNRKIAAWVCFGFGVFCLLMFPLLLTANDYKPYENYVVNGKVEECKIEKESITFKLDGDENTYRVNNLVYEKVSFDFKNMDVVGGSIKLYVAYTDKYGRRNVSQIEYRGGIYLDKEEAEALERGNFEGTQIMAYGFLGIGCALLVIWVTLLIIIKVRYCECVNCQTEDKNV